MDILMLLALPLMMLGGFVLDAATHDDDDAAERQAERRAEPDPQDSIL